MKKKKVYEQTGKRKSIVADKKRKAKLPGKRKVRHVSKNGKVTYTTYTETRRNRSDKKGKKI